MGVSYVNFSVIGFSVCLALGIAVGYWVDLATIFSVSKYVMVLVFASCFLLLLLTWLWNKKQLSPSPIFGVWVLLFFFICGFANYTLRLPKYQELHYLHQFIISENNLLQLKVTEVLKPDSFNNKYIAQVQKVGGASATGKVLVSIPKDSLSLAVDDVLLTYGTLQPVPAPKNPHQFNYAAYMKTLGVYAQMRLKQPQILTIKKGNTTIRGFSESIRDHLISKLKNTPLQTKERSILQALVLGQRRDIDKDLYSDYAAAGAIHILAVSGLHVGILYFIVLFLFKPLTYLRYGKIMRSILIVLFLWGFAVLAGLSPSVVRAVTMFTFFTFATAVDRPTNSFNTLFLSFFILLLFKPNWLFHVGFQLSYLAVFAILWIHPKLYKLYRPKFYVDRLFWNIITVSTAAQLGIVPLSLYYFHQFPGLFFVTNIVVLPVLGILLGAGLLLVFLAACNTLPGFFAEGYNYSLQLLNNFISWVAGQELFLWENIPFSKAMVLVSYLFLIRLVLLWKRFSVRRLNYCLVSMILLLAVLNWEKKQANFSEMIVFHKNRKTLIGVKQNKQLILFTTDTSTKNLQKNYPVKGYTTANSVAKVSEKTLPKYFSYKQNYVLVLDSLGVYPMGTKSPIVLLTHSPRVNLERLIDSLQPQQILADGSNYTSYVKRWQQTCKKKKLPFHHTGTKGAFTLK
ncbi:ComEC/Rec2 family competence protein [Marinirhabdus gelatinilytica]|uniref:Competence protein ComEC n=1 Tax=Marinirhabdus gelatinilytica TaxID=1703343 RepID=A0A370QL31_9FLAO|nr:ComEC/Rec2 family competence protein [Marinirhabdus gelatinilytica]RDK89084.1 competence protein ComEC [Marinirhabdus gelatinilytica]